MAFGSRIIQATTMDMATWCQTNSPMLEGMFQAIDSAKKKPAADKTRFDAALVNCKALLWSFENNLAAKDTGVAPQIFNDLKNYEKYMKKQNAGKPYGVSLKGKPLSFDEANARGSLSKAFKSSITLKQMQNVFMTEQKANKTNANMDKLVQPVVSDRTVVNRASVSRNQYLDASGFAPGIGTGQVLAQTIEYANNAVATLKSDEHDERANFWAYAGGATLTGALTVWCGASDVLMFASGGASKGLTLPITTVSKSTIRKFVMEVVKEAGEKNLNKAVKKLGEDNMDGLITKKLLEKGVLEIGQSAKLIPLKPQFFPRLKIIKEAPEIIEKEIASEAPKQAKSTLLNKLTSSSWYKKYIQAGDDKMISKAEALAIDNKEIQLAKLTLNARNNTVKKANKAYAAFKEGLEGTATPENAAKETKLLNAIADAEKEAKKALDALRELVTNAEKTPITNNIRIVKDEAMDLYGLKENASNLQKIFAGSRRNEIRAGAEYNRLIGEQGKFLKNNPEIGNAWKEACTDEGKIAQFLEDYPEFEKVFSSRANAKERYEAACKDSQEAAGNWLNALPPSKFSGSPPIRAWQAGRRVLPSDAPTKVPFRTYDPIGLGNTVIRGTSHVTYAMSQPQLLKEFGNSFIAGFRAVRTENQYLAKILKDDAKNKWKNYLIHASNRSEDRLENALNSGFTKWAKQRPAIQYGIVREAPFAIDMKKTDDLRKAAPSGGFAVSIMSSESGNTIAYDGHVAKASKEPVPNATIRLMAPGEKKASFFVKTDKDGFFLLEYDPSIQSVRTKEATGEYTPWARISPDSYSLVMDGNSIATVRLVPQAEPSLEQTAQKESIPAGIQEIPAPQKTAAPKYSAAWVASANSAQLASAEKTLRGFGAAKHPKANTVADLILALPANEKNDLLAKLAANPTQIEDKLKGIYDAEDLGNESPVSMKLKMTYQEFKKYIE